MIQINGFSGFVSKIIEISNKEKEDKVNWEFYLHRVADKSYSDFLKGLKVAGKVKNIEQADRNNNDDFKTEIKQTIENAMKVLDDFNRRG
ncbi:MAG: hypothetical protein HFE90_08935 [Firmicutes bacterium]|nr:hypothetical protein [Bacillota bacterium]